MCQFVARCPAQLEETAYVADAYQLVTGQLRMLSGLLVGDRVVRPRG
jgi:hypothetical protein